jgi:KDO2-lipid IV(A) lauroyltransferase
MPLWQSLLLRILLLPLALAASLLPRRAELALGALLGRLALAFAGRRREVALDNMRRCLPELDGDARRRLLRGNFEHYGVLALELLHLLSPIPGHWRRYAVRTARVEGIENWRRAHAKGKGVLFVSAHLANWELMVAAGAMAGVPLTLVTRHLKPEWLHEKIREARLSAGVRAAYLPDTLPTVLRALRRGESVGFAMDQYAHPPSGVRVPFFGIEVDTLSAVPALAQRFGSAILPASQERGPDGVVLVRIEPEWDPGPLREDTPKATAALAAKVEGWIRGNPAQWLWVHRRFKNL